MNIFIICSADLFIKVPVALTRETVICEMICALVNEKDGSYNCVFSDSTNASFATTLKPFGSNFGCFTANC